MKLLRSIFAAGVLLASLLSAIAPAGAADKPLRLGIVSGPYADISHFAADLAKKQGLEVQVVELADYTMPNAALAAGDLDFNNTQSKRYLAAQIKARGYDFAAVGDGIIVPLGLYSKKFAKLDDLPQSARIGIPNDPANGARALAFLEKRGLLKLRPGTQDTASPLDVAANPKGLRFVELDHGQLARSLDDTAASIITLNYALPAGLDPKKALALEDYANDFNTVAFVTTRARKDDPAIQRFIQIYRSQPVKDFVQKRFNGNVGTTW